MMKLVSLLCSPLLKGERSFFFSKLFPAFILIFLILGMNTQAATITSATTGNWNTASTWTAISRTGTITVALGGTTVTGVGTSFLTQLAVGSIIKNGAGTTVGTVSAIATDLSLTISPAAIAMGGVAYTASIVPTSTDDVVIAATHNVTVNASTTCLSVSVGNGSTLSVNLSVILVVTNTLSFPNLVSANSTGVLSGSGTINAGSMSIGGTVVPTGNGIATITSTISTLNVLGNLTLKSQGTTSPSRTNNPTFQLQSGIVTINGTLEALASGTGATSATSTVTLQTGTQTGSLILANSTATFSSGGGTFTTLFNGTNATVNYSGSAQTVVPVSFRNLILSGSGNKTFTSATTISGNLSISGTAVALLPDGTSSSALTLTLGGAGAILGSWGGTTSAATNKNSLYFGSSTTGILNVTNGTCITPNVTNFSTPSASAVCTGNGSVVTVNSSSLASGTYSVTYNVSGDNIVASTTASMVFTAGTPGTGTFTTALLTNAGVNNQVNLTRITSLGACFSVVASSTPLFTTTLGTTPSFIAQPGASACLGVDVTYTTQSGSGESNYVWGIPGIEGIDYSLTSGGTSADPTVMLKWLTTGSKTVTINYTKGGCTVAIPTSSTATTISSLPTITLSTTGTVSCYNASSQTSSLPYSATTGTTYSIDFGAAAEALIPPFVDVPYTAIPVSPISISIPAGAPAGSYNGNLTVKNANGCVSTLYPITVSIVSSVPASPVLSATAENTCSSSGGGIIPVTVYSSSLASGTYTVTYNLTGVANGQTASMIFNQATGSGTFTTIATASNPATVTITALAVGTCSATGLSISTNAIANEAISFTGATVTMSGSTTDANNPFGSTISITLKSSKFNVGTYRLSYTINPGGINGTAIVTFTKSRKQNTYVASFTTGQLAANTYTITINSFAYYPSTSCTASTSYATSFQVLTGGSTIQTKGGGAGTGSYNDGNIWQGVASGSGGPDYNSSTIIISAGDVVTVDGLLNAPDILKVDQFIINGTLHIAYDEILQILDGSGTDITIGGSGQLILDATQTVSSITYPGGTLTYIGNVTQQGTGTTKVTFNAGSIYRHQAITTEGAPPLAAWNATSTVYVEGYTNYATAFSSANWSQNFGNFTWNCTNQTSDVNLNGLLGLTPATTGNIQGDITIQSTGSGILRFGLASNHYLTTPKDFITSNAARFAFADNSGSGPDVFLSVKNFTYGSTASSWLCDRGKNTVSVSGNFAINSGTVYLSSGANTKSGAEVSISGNMTVSGGELDASDTNNDRSGKVNFVNLASPGEHLFTNTGTIQGQILWTIAANQIVRTVDSSPIVSARTTADAFTLAAGAKLIVESTDPNGAIQSGTTAGNLRIPDTGRTFASGSSIEFNRTTPQAQFISGTGHPTTAGVNCIINNASGVTVTSAGTVTIGGNLTISSGNLTVTNSNLTVQQITNTAGGNLIFNTSSFDATPQTALRTITFNGALNMTGGQVLVTSGALDASNAILQINGDFQGTNFFTFAGANNRVLIGGVARTFSRPFPISSSTTLEYLNMNFTSGSLTSLTTLAVPQILTLGNPTTNTDGLTLTNGNVDMNANLLVTANTILTNGTLYFEGVQVELRRNIVSSSTGLFSSSSGSTLSITTNFAGTPADNLTFSNTGNTLGTLTINRTNNFASQANVALSNALTISGNLFLTDGGFYAPSGFLTMASGATITRTPDAEFYTGSSTPGGGPYHVIYNNNILNSLSSGLELTGSLNNVTSNLTGTATLTNAITGIGALTVNSGIFDCVNFAVAMNSVSIANAGTLNAPTDNTLTLTGNFANNGTFNSAYNVGSGNSSVIFNGTSTISGSSTTDFNFITLNTTKMLTGPALMRVKRDLNFGSGSIYNNSKGTIELNGSVNQNITANNTVGTQDLSMADDAFMLTTMHLYSITVNKSGGLVNLNQGGSDPQLKLGHLLDIQSATNVVSQGKLLLLSQNKSTYLDASIGPILNGGTVTGAVEVQRFMGETVHALFRYIASPVKVGAIPSVVNKIYRYNTPTNTWVWDFNNMSTGMGYTTLTYSPVDSRWSVKDDIHIGSFTYPAFPVAGWYLIGNPYASAIQWRDQNDGNASTDGWDVNNVNLVSTIMAITDNNVAGYPNYFHYYDYASPANPGWGTSPVAGSGTIAMGQSFWVYGLAGGIITVKEPAKKSVNTQAAAGQFYRQRDQSVSEQLAISINNGKMQDQSFLIVNPKATESFDFNLDLPKLWNRDMNVYLADKSSESMLMLALSEIPNKIPVGIKVTEPGEYELSFMNAEAFNQSLYLIDRYENEAIPVSSDLRYRVTIKDASKPVNDRFYLSVSADIEINKDAIVSIYPNPVTELLTIQIKGQKNPSPVSLFDMTGKELKSTEVKREGTINVSDFKSGIYILKVQTEQGIFVQKIVKE